MMSWTCLGQDLRSVSCKFALFTAKKPNNIYYHVLNIHNMQYETWMQLLLSSSIDKTVRLWDVETQSCLKMFAHNDYGEMPKFRYI